MVIVIYFERPGKMSYPFDNKKYFESYKVLAKLAESQDIGMYFARGVESYTGNMRFLSGYQFLHDELIRINQPFIADVIYVKGKRLKLGKNDIAINNPELKEICGDKMKTYTLFHKYMSPTYEINENNYKEILKKITTEKIVIKPYEGSEGKDITIIDKDKFNPDILSSSAKEFLAQEFVDSSYGIQGLIKGLHDLRLFIFDGEVKFSYIRTPKEGSFLANIAQGGSLQYVPIHTIPVSAITIAKEVDEKFKKYTPRLYAIDLMYQKDTPYIVELNDQPGLPYMEEDEFVNVATNFLLELLNVLKKSCK